MTDIPSGSSDYREDAIGTCKKKASKVSWTYLGPELFGGIRAPVNFINYTECVEKII